MPTLQQRQQSHPAGTSSAAGSGMARCRHGSGTHEKVESRHDLVAPVLQHSRGETGLRLRVTRRVSGLFYNDIETYNVVSVTMIDEKAEHFSAFAV